MEFVRSISKKYKVCEGLLRAAIAVKPRIKYTPQEIVSLCESNGYPVLLPEDSNEVVALLVASRLQGIGEEFLISKLRYSKIARFEDADKVWDYYSEHLFDGLIPRRLYINNVRVDFSYAVASGTILKFWVDGPFPEQAEFNHLYGKSVFINDTLYSVTRVYIEQGDLVFLWTTP